NNSIIMPEYKLVYFAFRGLGEVPRQLFSLAGVKFENVRIEDADWDAGKRPETPFGQMPVLFVDGKPIPQSFAINRYIANQYGFAGKTPFEAALVDAFADQFKDFNTEFKKYWYVKQGDEPGDVEEMKAKHGIPARDSFFPLVVKQLKKSGSGFIVGDAVTWVDVLVANATDYITVLEKDLLNDYPEILAHKEKIHSLPGLKEWLKIRE
ncbi:gst-20, partial [Pristionchus pacificus]